jgi:hypothetical protein
MSDSETNTHIRRKYYKNLDDPEHLTANGTRRKNKFRPELAGLDKNSTEYNTRHMRIRRAELKAQKEIW